MTVKLETDEQNQKKGFSANYELLANEPSGCGTTDKMQEADKGDEIKNYMTLIILTLPDSELQQPPMKLVRQNPIYNNLLILSIHPNRLGTEHRERDLLAGVAEPHLLSFFHTRSC